MAVSENNSKTENVFARLKKRVVDNYFKTIGWVLPFYLQLYVIVPIIVQKNNLEEYSFSVMDMLFSSLNPLMVSTLGTALIISMFGEKIRKIIYSFFGVFFVLGYLQFNFMNGKLGLLNGDSFHLIQYPVDGVVNLIIWLVIIIFYVYLYNILDKDNVCRCIVLFLAFVQVITFIFAFFYDFDSNFSRRCGFYTSESRFDLAKNQNVILFCFDAVDNSFLKALYDMEYDFTDFKDFTMYENTCSVFDVTDLSMVQMVTASDFELNDNYPYFYKKLKNSNFNIRFYNYDGALRVPVGRYVDNYIEVYPDDVYLNYHEMFSEGVVLSFYLLNPYVIKNFIKVDELDFVTQVTISGEANEYYLNEEYMDHLKLKINDEYENSFIYEHIYGAHQPCDNFIEKTGECMDIAKEYIRQLKMLGVYDNATIIFISDHGVHDDQFGVSYQTASTPIFLIKGKNESHDEMFHSTAPIYHKDILSTILVNIGCYDSVNDNKLFGPSIYDFNDSDIRERVWYNRMIDESGFYKYRYYGDTKELEKKVDNGDYDEIKDIFSYTYSTF